jgi:hypothetical protein
MGARRFRTVSEIHEISGGGRILVVSIEGSSTLEISHQIRLTLEREVEENDPLALVINLTKFHSRFGNDFLGALIAGAVAMRKQGSGRPTRIVSRGRTADVLSRCLAIGKVLGVFGGELHTDVESALNTIDSNEGSKPV